MLSQCRLNVGSLSAVLVQPSGDDIYRLRFSSNHEIDHTKWAKCIQLCYKQNEKKSITIGVIICHSKQEIQGIQTLLCFLAAV